MINKLMKELCPNGVECIALTKLFITKNGYTPSKSQKEYWIDGTIPWFRMEDIRENGRILNSSLQNVSKDAIKSGICPANSIIVSTSATIGEHALITVESLANQRFTYLILREEYKKIFNIKFLYYYCFNLDKYCLSHLKKGNFASVDMTKFEKFKFPIPPLPVQAEIVRILDNFTELTAELTARKRQYEFYRCKLLSFDDSVNYKTIEEIFEIKNGYTPSKSNKSFWENGELPWFRMEDIRENGRVLSSAKQQITMEAAKNKPFAADSIIVSTSATIGEHALIKVDFLCNQRFTCLTLKKEYKDIYDVTFLYYYCYKLDEFCLSNLNKGNFASVDMSKFCKFKIPLIDITEQKNIVSILNRFDILCNNISEGLPAEISARQKQYEYYRDKLLTFSEIGAC